MDESLRREIAAELEREFGVADSSESSETESEWNRPAPWGSEQSFLVDEPSVARTGLSFAKEKVEYKYVENESTLADEAKEFENSQNDPSLSAFEKEKESMNRLLCDKQENSNENYSSLSGSDYEEMVEKRTDTEKKSSTEEQEKKLTKVDSLFESRKKFNLRPLKLNSIKANDELKEQWDFWESAFNINADQSKIHRNMVRRFRIHRDDENDLIFCFYTDEFQCQFNVVTKEDGNLGELEMEVVERIMKLGRVNEFLKRDEFEELCERLQRESSHIVTRYEDEGVACALVSTNPEQITGYQFPHCSRMWFNITDDFCIEVSWVAATTGDGSDDDQQMSVKIQLPMEAGYLQELDSCAVLDVLDNWYPNGSSKEIEFFQFYRCMWEKYHFVWMRNDKKNCRIWIMPSESDDGKPEFRQDIAKILTDRGYQKIVSNEGVPESSLE